MRKILFSLFIATAAFSAELDVVKLSEAVGHMLGKNLQNFGLDFDLDAIAKGLKEESEGKASPLDEEECVQAITELQDEKMSLTTQKTLEQADATSNGNELYENHPFPTANPAKHR